MENESVGLFLMNSQNDQIFIIPEQVTGIEAYEHGTKIHYMLADQFPKTECLESPPHVISLALKTRQNQTKN